MTYEGQIVSHSWSSVLRESLMRLLIAVLAFIAGMLLSPAHAATVQPVDPWTIPMLVLNVWGIFVIVGFGLGLLTLVGLGLRALVRR